MDRQIVYPASIPQDIDILNTNKNALVGLGFLAQDVLGTGTVVGGLPCTQTAPASLAVLIGGGRIYSQQNVDGAAYGSVAADITHQIVKQGILLDPVTLNTPAPATAGFSVNYLIQAAYQDSDTNAVVLPYFNSNNPNVPFVGPNNNGIPQPTKRQGLLVVEAKPGIAAATGTQTTPAPDAGFVGLYVVTVANGQASVLAGNITQVATAPFLGALAIVQTGTFIPAFTGITGQSVTASWVKIAGQVTLVFNSPVAGTSNSNALTINNLPPAIQLVSGSQVISTAVVNNGQSVPAAVAMLPGSPVATFSVLSGSSYLATGFAATGTKGPAGPLTYLAI